MSTFDATGYTKDSFATIKAKLEADLKTAFTDNIKLEPGSVFGQLVSIFAEAVSDMNDLIEGIISAYNPQASEGAFLSALVLLNGITRNENEYSTVSLSCTANVGGATIPAGSLVSDPAVGEQFATDALLVVAPSATDTVSATAVNPGAIPALAGTLTQIDTPVYGWESVTNLANATEGQDEETDPELRLRRQRAAEITGTANTTAIYSAVADLAAVEAVYIHENNTDVIDSYNVPPQHIWAIVLGGADADIAEALFDTVGAGVGYYGTTSVVHVDDYGNSHTIKFSRPSDVPIYVSVTVVTDSDYPVDGDDQIEDAILAMFDDYTMNDDVIYSRLYTPINSVPGHYVSALTVDTVTPPVATANITIAINERAVSDAAKVVITSV